MGEVVDDIDIMFDWYHLTVKSGYCFGVHTLLFELLAFFFGMIMLRGNKYSVEGDGSQYDSVLIMTNNPCIIFAVEGNWLLVDIVSNGSKLPVRFRDRFRPGTGPLQPVSNKNPAFEVYNFGSN